MKYTLIRPGKKWEFYDFKECWKFRGVFNVLLMRDIKLKYQQTFLGVFWVVLQPLMMSVVFAWMFSRVISLNINGLPYYPFAFVAMIVWNFFSQSVQKASQSVVGNSSLVTKVYFPRILLPCASVGSGLYDFFVCLPVVFGVLFWYDMPLTINLFSLPFWVFLVLVYGMSLGVLFSACVVYYRDFGHLLPFAFQLLMYLSPILYTTESVPQRWKFLYCFNPLVALLDGFRWCFLGYPAFPLQSLIQALCVISFFAISSLFIFRRMERYFADVI